MCVIEPQKGSAAAIEIIFHSFLKKKNISQKNRSLSHTYALVMAAAAAYKWIHKFFSTIPLLKHEKFYFFFLFKNIQHRELKFCVWMQFMTPFFGHKFHAIFLSLHFCIISTALRSFYVCCTLHCVKLKPELYLMLLVVIESNFSFPMGK